MKVLAVIPCIILLALSSCDVTDGESENPGEIIWSVDNAQSNSVSTQPLIDGNRVFVLQDGDLRAYRLTDGVQIWSSPLLSEGNTRIVSFNFLSDDDLVFVDTGYDYRAYNKSTGSLEWYREFTNNGSEFAGPGSAQISQDDDHLYLPRNGKVLQVQKNNGAVIKEFVIDRLIPDGLVQGATNPTPSPFGDGILYVPTAYQDTENEHEKLTGNLFAFDIHTGDLLWEFKGPEKVMPTEEFEATDSMEIGTPMREIKLTEDYIAVASNPTILLLDRLTGELIWQVPLKYRRFAGTPGEENSFDGVLLGMAADQSGIYVTSMSGLARKLDWSDGSEIWNVDIIYTSTSLLTVIDDKLYFNNNGGGGIWVIDTISGETIFNNNPPGKPQNSHDVYLSSLAVGNGYMVNVGALRLYALRSFE